MDIHKCLDKLPVSHSVNNIGRIFKIEPYISPHQAHIVAQMLDLIMTLINGRLFYPAEA
ncbi:MAG: hypothetical protein II817_07340 [Bacteroidales bacterium]|nr:hypothetical protein [Bacteroidales bacterium]